MAEKLLSMISYEMIMNFDPEELHEITGQKAAATEIVGLITCLTTKYIQDQVLLAYWHDVCKI